MGKDKVVVLHYVDDVPPVRKRREKRKPKQRTPDATPAIGEESPLTTLRKRGNLKGTRIA